VQPNRGVRFGASSHVARFLLAAREFDSELRFAVNCRFGDDVERALDDLDWPVTEYDRGEEPGQVKEADEGTMGWGARQAFAEREATPVAVIDRGEVGKEAVVKLVAASGETLTEQVFSLLDALDG
jgi:hydroxymethylpyrimidine/phosphomethylpyrimidine kinase